MNFVLFETTDTIIEVLWDIALAFFIVRLAFIYFALTFVSAAALVYITYSYPSLLQLPLVQFGGTLTPLLLLLCSALCAYVVVSRYEIPRVTGFRLATGAVALLFMVLADAAVGLGLWQEGYGGWMGQTVGLGFAGLLAAFALMPTLLMVFEARLGKREDDGTWYGHEKKSVIDAV
jgi:hypothetical protein